MKTKRVISTIVALIMVFSAFSMGPSAKIKRYDDWYSYSGNDPCIAKTKKDLKFKKPKKVKGVKVKAKGYTRINVKWKKVRGATFYQVAYRPHKKGAKWRTFIGATYLTHKTLNLVENDIRSGTKYCIKVRACKTKTLIRPETYKKTHVKELEGYGHETYKAINHNITKTKWGKWSKVKHVKTKTYKKEVPALETLPREEFEKATMPYKSMKDKAFVAIAKANGKYSDKNLREEYFKKLHEERMKGRWMVRTPKIPHAIETQYISGKNKGKTEMAERTNHSNFVRCAPRYSIKSVTTVFKTDLEREACRVSKGEIKGYWTEHQTCSTDERVRLIINGKAGPWVYPPNYQK